MEAPKEMQALPPLTSTLAGSAAGAGNAIAAKINMNLPLRRGADAQPPMQQPVVESPETTEIPDGEMTLADLSKMVGTQEIKETVHGMQEAGVLDVEEADADESGWSPGDFLKSQVPQVRRSGASLAAAAVNKLRKV